MKRTGKDQIAFVDPGALHRPRPRNDLRPVASTLPRPLQPPTGFTEWASPPLAQDHAGWRKLVTEPPFELGKHFVRQPRGDTSRVTPEDKQRLAEQRAAEIAKWRADFNATNN